MIVLLSFPRSGSTWLQYIISESSDIMSVNSTFEFSIKQKFSLSCIRKNIDLECLDVLRKVAVKSHDFDSYQILDDGAGRSVRLDPLWKHPTVKEQISLIFMLRDYRECVLRNTLSSEGQSWDEILKSYLTVLQQYENFKGPKILVRYESLITKPDDTIKKVLHFLKVFDEKKYNAFCSRIDFHKKKSLDLYIGESHWGGHKSYTRGDSDRLNFHRESLDENLPSGKMITERFVEMAGRDVLKRYFGEKDA